MIFCDWLFFFSHNVFKVCPCCSTNQCHYSFYDQTIFHGVDTALLLCSFINRCTFGLCPPFGCHDNAAMNIHIQVSGQDIRFLFSWVPTPRSKIAGSCNSVLSFFFFEEPPYLFLRSDTILHSQVISPHPHQHFYSHPRGMKWYLFLWFVLAFLW